MQLKKTSKKKGNLNNEIITFSNGYFSFNNIDSAKKKVHEVKEYSLLPFIYFHF